MTTQEIEYTAAQLKEMYKEMYRIGSDDENLDEHFRATAKGNAATEAATALKYAAKDLAVFETGKVNSHRPAVVKTVNRAVEQYNKFKATY